MDTICAHLQRDHEFCDGLFADVEHSVDARDWERASICAERYVQAMERHIAMEEEVLFPAFERLLGQAHFPIEMLRTEHRQLSLLLERTRAAVRAADPAEFALHAETIVLLHQQHSAKEDAILYPVLDRHLAADRGPVLAAMYTVRNPSCAPADSC